MNKYAMPVDPRVLEQDFESTPGSIQDIEDMVNILISVVKPKDISPQVLVYINQTISKLWFRINKKTGINLRDREKLIPLFAELDRIFKSKERHYVAYRGARLARYDGNAISEVYARLKLKGSVVNNSKEPRVVNHLESLAYGLRSWSSEMGDAINWASGHIDGGKDKISDRDQILFLLRGPNVILDANPTIKYFNKVLKDSKPMFDNNELLVHVNNPKIMSIERISFTKPVYQVVLTDSSEIEY